MSPHVAGLGKSVELQDGRAQVGTGDIDGESKLADSSKFVFALPSSYRQIAVKIPALNYYQADGLHPRVAESLSLISHK